MPSSPVVLPDYHRPAASAPPQKHSRDRILQHSERSAAFLATSPNSVSLNVGGTWNGFVACIAISSSCTATWLGTFSLSGCSYAGFAKALLAGFIAVVCSSSRRRFITKSIPNAKNTSSKTMTTTTIATHFGDSSSGSTIDFCRSKVVVVPLRQAARMEAACKHRCPLRPRSEHPGGTRTQPAHLALVRTLAKF